MQPAAKHLDRPPFRPFASGHIAVTRAVAAHMEAHARTRERVAAALVLHLHGDWGDVDPCDRTANNAATDPDNPGRILSQYEDAAGPTLWIITEADRSTTTILFPSDY